MTPDQQRWLDMRTAYRNHDYNNCHGFKNMAVTMAGELVIGLTKNTQFWHYSALYLERDGERLTGVFEWDLDGKARGEHSDLNMGTVNEGVRKI